MLLINAVKLVGLSVVAMAMQFYRSGWSVSFFLVSFFLSSSDGCMTYSGPKHSVILGTNM